VSRRIRGQLLVFLTYFQHGIFLCLTYRDLFFIYWYATIVVADNLLRKRIDDEHNDSCQGSPRRRGMTKTQRSKQLHGFERSSACWIILCYIFKCSIVSEPAPFGVIYMAIQVSVTSRERHDVSQESSDLVLKSRRVAMRKIQRLTQRLFFLITSWGLARSDYGTCIGLRYTYLDLLQSQVEQ